MNAPVRHQNQISHEQHFTRGNKKLAERKIVLWHSYRTHQYDNPTLVIQKQPIFGIQKATGTSPVASSVHVILCYVHMDNIANNTAQLP
ncbi:hypothetical protein MKY42_12525 [Paenibacillus sp. FSL W7-1088]|uniref:hypothetical protein n=1 Tax=Paenibacillus sp. FSL W7-1088 TaxID=2921695 RepID=UPI0030ECC4DF